VFAELMVDAGAFTHQGFSWHNGTIRTGDLIRPTRGLRS
jgi:hypothetical protein